MFDTIGGLPLHPLVVHATEVTVPLAALAVLLAALWPWFRRWAGVLPVLLTLAALVLVPVSKESGEQLEHRVGESSLIETHSQLADMLLPWVAGLLVAAAAVTWWWWRERSARVAGTTGRAVPTVVAVLIALGALAMAGGTTVQAVLVGHSGATAVWQEDMAKAPAGGADNDD